MTHVAAVSTLGSEPRRLTASDGVAYLLVSSFAGRRKVVDAIAADVRARHLSR